MRKVEVVIYFQYKVLSRVSTSTLYQLLLSITSVNFYIINGFSLLFWDSSNLPQTYEVLNWLPVDLVIYVCVCVFVCVSQCVSLGVYGSLNVHSQIDTTQNDS